MDDLSDASDGGHYVLGGSERRVKGSVENWKEIQPILTREKCISSVRLLPRVFAGALTRARGVLTRSPFFGMPTRNSQDAVFKISIALNDTEKKEILFHLSNEVIISSRNYTYAQPELFGTGRIQLTAKLAAREITPIIHMERPYSLPLYRKIIEKTIPPRLPRPPTRPETTPNRDG